MSNMDAIEMSELDVQLPIRSTASSPPRTDRWRRRSVVASSGSEPTPRIGHTRRQLGRRPSFLCALNNHRQATRSSLARRHAGTLPSLPTVYATPIQLPNIPSLQATPSSTPPTIQNNPTPLSDIQALHAWPLPASGPQAWPQQAYDNTGDIHWRRVITYIFAFTVIIGIVLFIFMIAVTFYLMVKEN